MKSNIIRIDNMGKGFHKAIAETRKVCVYNELDHRSALRLQLCAEEQLSLARSVTREMDASFWIETEGPEYTLHMSTNTDIDKEKRSMLLKTASSGKNEAANSFIGKLRDLFETAIDAEPNYNSDLPSDVLEDLANRTIQCSDAEWNGYEQSTLKRLADTIKISIIGNVVEVTVIKTFA
ncbi:MAG: hypothetical protein IKP40_09265 [Clostridia bacterium]|nr:hypothetical protein [Clostridia bacterium]